MPDELEEQPSAESTTVPTLIRTYGEFWNPNLVDWEDSWNLWGKRTRKGADINVYEERGVYVLYKDFVPVYVGRADRQSIGYRLQSHRVNVRKGPRWDRFSWFGILGLTKNNELRSRKGAFHPNTEELIATLEALLIAVIDPRLNSRKEKFRNAVRLMQSERDRPLDMDERLASIEKMLAQLVDSKGGQV